MGLCCGTLRTTCVLIFPTLAYFHACFLFHLVPKICKTLQIVICKVGCLLPSALILVVAWLIFCIFLNYPTLLQSWIASWGVLDLTSWHDESWPSQSVYGSKDPYSNLILLSRIFFITFLNLAFHSRPCLVTSFITFVTSSLDILFKSSPTMIFAKAWFTGSSVVQNVSNMMVSWSPWSYGANKFLNLTHACDKRSSSSCLKYKMLLTSCICPTIKLLSGPNLPSLAPMPIPCGQTNT